MTDTPEPSTAVAVPDDGKIAGLEDVEASDLVMPRFTIIGKEALFEDSLSKEKHAELNVIMLGRVKQRVLWPADVDEANRPLCKSYDGITGNADPGSFPWSSAGFKADDHPGEEPQLPCKACKLKEWDTHPTRKIPWCTEQWVFPLITSEGAAALLTIQRSGIKNAKDYVTYFHNRGTPMFHAYTKLTLSAQRKGSVDFSVPVFEKTGDTDEEQWPRLGAQLVSIQQFLQTPRSFSDDAGTSDAPAAPASAPAATGGGADEPGEIPF